MAQGEYQQRRQDRAHKRYPVRAQDPGPGAKARRLCPCLQVNIATQASQRRRWVTTGPVRCGAVIGLDPIAAGASQAPGDRSFSRPAFLAAPRRR